MKNIGKICISFFVICTIWLFASQTLCAENADGWEYQILADETVEITGYTGEDVNLIIPEVIEGYRVSKIGQEAFAYNENIQEVTIPATISKVGWGAFRACSRLQKAKFSTDINFYSTQMFLGCPNLQEITFLSGKRNNTLGWLFGDMEGLKNIYVDSEQKNYASVDGVLFSADLTELIYYPIARADVSYTVPKGTKVIKKDAFPGDCKVKELHLPDSVEEFAIDLNLNLETLYIGKNLRKLTLGTLYGLKNIVVNKNNAHYTASEGVLFNKNMSVLICYPSGKTRTTYTIPKQVKTIKAHAFKECGKIQKVSCPATLKTIGEEAFKYCVELQSVDLGKNVTDIGDYAFLWTSVDVIRLPDTIASVKANSFKLGEHYVGDPDLEYETDDSYVPYYAELWYEGTKESWNQRFPSFKGYDSISFNVCLNNKTVHNYKNVITKATFSSQGKRELKCTKCNRVKKLYSTWAKIGSVKLSSVSYSYNGKVKTPTVTVKNAKGKKLIKGTDYTVTYAKGRKNVGKYTVTVKFKNKYKGTVKKTFTITPKKTSITKLTSGKKAFTVKWTKKSPQVSGYQVKYSRNKSFTGKYTRTKTVSGYTKTSRTVSKLKAKQMYYVKVRTYKTVKVNGKSTKIYSGWSDVKKVTTK